MRLDQFVEWVIGQEQNTFTIINSFISGAIALLVAAIGICVSFTQLKRQFRYKVIYEGWKDFQSTLFEYSSSITAYYSIISNIEYALNNQDNPLVNKGDRDSYRLKNWNEINDCFQTMNSAYVSFLRSFETHQVVFHKLNQMKKIFNKKQYSLIFEGHLELMDKIYPEMSGAGQNLTTEQMIEITKSYCKDVLLIQVFLEDFRIELQNASIAKVLGRKLDRRNPDKGEEILTPKGIKTQKKQPRREWYDK